MSRAKREEKEDDPLKELVRSAKSYRREGRGVIKAVNLGQAQEGDSIPMPLIAIGTHKKGRVLQVGRRRRKIMKREKTKEEDLESDEEGGRRRERKQRRPCPRSIESYKGKEKSFRPSRRQTPDASHPPPGAW